MVLIQQQTPLHTQMVLIPLMGQNLQMELTLPMVQLVIIKQMEQQISRSRFYLLDSMDRALHVSKIICVTVRRIQLVETIRIRVVRV
jgi:hypothetical protein